MSTRRAASRPSRISRDATPTTQAAIPPGYCECGESWGTAEKAKALHNRLVCRRCGQPISGGL